SNFSASAAPSTAAGPASICVGMGFDLPELGIDVSREDYTLNFSIELITCANFVTDAVNRDSVHRGHRHFTHHLKRLFGAAVRNVKNVIRGEHHVGSVFVQQLAYVYGDLSAALLAR